MRMQWPLAMVGMLSPTIRGRSPTRRFMCCAVLRIEVDDLRRRLRRRGKDIGDFVVAQPSQPITDLETNENVTAG